MILVVPDLISVAEMPFLVLAFFLIFMNTVLGGRRQCKAVATERRD